MKIFLATKNKGKIEDFKKLTEDMDIEVVTILDKILRRRLLRLRNILEL